MVFFNGSLDTAEKSSRLYSKNIESLSDILMKTECWLLRAITPLMNRHCHDADFGRGRGLAGAGLCCVLAFPQLVSEYRHSSLQDKTTCRTGANDNLTCAILYKTSFDIA